MWWLRSKNMTANPIMRILSCLITTRLDNTTTRLVVVSTVVSAAFQPPSVSPASLLWFFVPQNMIGMYIYKVVVSSTNINDARVGCTLNKLYARQILHRKCSYLDKTNLMKFLLF